MEKETPTISTRLNVLSLYRDCPILICEPGAEPVPHPRIEGFDFDREMVIAERTDYPAHWIRVGVKHLGSITDEDAIQAALLAGYDKDDGAPRSTLIEFGKKATTTYWHHHRSNIFGDEWQRIIDFLRSRGYALPYGSYSVEELYNHRIYIFRD